MWRSRRSTFLCCAPSFAPRLLPTVPASLYSSAMPLLLPGYDVDRIFPGLCPTPAQRDKGNGAPLPRRSRPLRHQPHKGGRDRAHQTCDKDHQTYRHQLGGHFLVMEGGSQISASLTPVRIEVADHKAVPASGTRNLRASCLVHQIGQGQLLREVNLEIV